MKIQHAFCCPQHKSAVDPVLDELRLRGHEVVEVRLVHGSVNERCKGYEDVDVEDSDVFICAYPHILKTGNGEMYQKAYGKKVCIEHGINPIAWAFPLDRHALFDVICCANKWQMEKGKKQGNLDSKLFLTGWGKTDHLPKKRSVRDVWKMALEDKMKEKFVEGKPIVAWVPTHGAAWKRTDEIRKLGIPNLVIVPHEGRYRAFRENMDINYEKEYPYYLQTTDIHSVLAAADVVLTDYSSAGIEALAVEDLPIIQILADVKLHNRNSNPMQTGYYALSQGDGREFKLGPNIADLSKLPAEIEAAANDPTGYWQRERDEWRKELLHDVGNATSNTCDLIESFGKPCKVCGGSVRPLRFTRELNRPDFPVVNQTWYQCVGCKFMFTDALDHFTQEDWSRFYAYPEYLKYDPGAVMNRRAPRTIALIKHVEKRFEMKKPKVLLNGLGVCSSLIQLMSEEYDVYATHGHFNFDNCITMQEAVKMGDFDIVCSTEVIEHYAYPKEDFTLVRAMLKQGGVFCGTTCLSDGVDPAKMINDEWHYLKQHTINAGHVSVWSEDAFDVMAKFLNMENKTEHGDKELRTTSIMPSTSKFFQFVKK